MISSLSLLRICQLELERAIQSPVVVKLGCVKAGASGLVRWYNKNTKFTHLPSLSSSHLNSSMKRVFIENSYFSRRPGHSCPNSSWKGDIKIHKNKKKMWDIINAAGVVQISATQIPRRNHLKLDWKAWGNTVWLWRTYREWSCVEGSKGKAAGRDSGGRKKRDLGTTESWGTFYWPENQCGERALVSAGYLTVACLSLLSNGGSVQRQGPCTWGVTSPEIPR